MKKIIDDYIAREKEIQPSPYLESRILAHLNASNTEDKAIEASLSTNLWKGFAMAAGIIIMIITGISLGNIYNCMQSEDILLIDDSHMEQFLLYDLGGKDHE
jgi:hypothetical protein